MAIQSYYDLCVRDDGRPHIRRMRRLYEQRRRILVEAIDRKLGDAFELMGAEAGMYLTLLARRPLRDAAPAAQAARHRLWLAALPLSCAGRTRVRSSSSDLGIPGQRKSPRPCAF